MSKYQSSRDMNSSDQPKDHRNKAGELIIEVDIDHLYIEYFDSSDATQVKGRID